MDAYASRKDETGAPGRAAPGGSNGPTTGREKNKMKMTIEQDHVSIERRLLRRLAIEHPDEILLRVRNENLSGAAVVRYLDALPIGRGYVTNCPTPMCGGACGCRP